jgi:PqqA peptide cyclase
MTELPYTLIAELTHRCPLSCAYCSNPVQSRTPAELEADTWSSVLEQARELGVVQAHFTGGEPLLHAALGSLIARGSELGLSTQLVTSGVGLARERLRDFVGAGLSSIQVSLHRVGARSWPPEHALRAAIAARSLELPLTLNLVLHRKNLELVEPAIALAERLGAERLELANVQYLGWAFENKRGLLPDLAALERARTIAARARDRLRGSLALLFVLPDHHAGRPRACMGGWGRRFVVVAPDGTVLPCHAAKLLGLDFDNVLERSLSEIWFESAAFRRFRGDDWMQEPCRSCDRKQIDFGGCRCQALLLAGDPNAADPACRLSPHHDRVIAALAAADDLVQLRPRRSA